jgi:hypothetical protein
MNTKNGSYKTCLPVTTFLESAEKQDKNVIMIFTHEG